MHIAIDISPIDPVHKSDHKVRGVGKYITLLKDNLEKFDKKNSYIFSSKPERENVDLVHYPYFDPFFITLPLKKHKKTIVTVHDVIPLIHKEHFQVGVKGNLKWQLNKQLLKRVDAIITDSNASKDDIHEITGFNKSKINPVYLAAESDYIHLNLNDKEKSEIKDTLKLPEKYILYVGDVTWNKNLPRLIKAVEQVKVPLVMVGKALTENEFDRSNPWNKDRITVNRLTENNPLFIKPGFVDNKTLNKIYNCAQLLVMPSLDEGFGLPALEAMQAGCPVLLSKSGSLPEVGGDAALYTDAQSGEDISDKISKMLESKEVLRDLSSKSLEQSKKFTLEKFIKETIKVYENIIP